MSATPWRLRPAYRTRKKKRRPAPRRRGRWAIRVLCPGCGRHPLAPTRLLVTHDLTCPYCGGTIPAFGRRVEARRQVKASLEEGAT